MMPHRTAARVFDFDQFMKDAIDTLVRWDLPKTTFALSMGLDATSLNRILDGQRQPSLYLVCKIAKGLDLDLNKYVLEED